MDLCMVEKREPGLRMAAQWWEQEVLDMEGMQTKFPEAEETDGT